MLHKGEGLGNTADRLKKLDKSKEEDQVRITSMLMIPLTVNIHQCFSQLKRVDQSTEYQWEVTEVGCLSCFIEFLEPLASLAFKLSLIKWVLWVILFQIFI